jgi:carbonic anhydrase/acetyltransferase-like protein (isoleucine patch superfamily)
VPIYALGDLVPDIHPDAFVHPDAVVIGSVEIGAGASIWPCAVLRGDNGHIKVGARTSIQDGSVLHCTPEVPTTVGEDCVVGHLVHLEGCTVEDRCLIGNGSILLHWVVVRTGALVGAAAMLPDRMEVPSGTMALGVPAKIREKAPDPDEIAASARIYVERGARYLRELRAIG